MAAKPGKLSKAPTAEYSRVFKYITDPSPENAKAADVREFFRQLFKDQFSYEANAENADGYVRGRLLIELKGKHEDWLPGFYQALHYAKKGLGFAHVTVLADNFIGLWRVNKIPDFAKRLSTNALPLLAPSAVGAENAAKSRSKADKAAILASADFLYAEPQPEKVEFGKGANVNAHAYLQKLRYLDEERVPVTLNTFLPMIEALETIFPSPLAAVLAFYDIVNYWDITSTVASSETDPYHMRVVGKKGSFMSEPVAVAPDKQLLFKRFVEQYYVFTNEGSGITTDDYFARFDEAMAARVPDYVRQHGIYFTDLKLARLALWFTDTYFDAGLTDNYIVLDPAGGSGNLVSSWRRHVQHKIVAELQPDLLRVIDRRFRADEEEAMRGFTIVPRVSENRGLNFLDQPAATYYQHLHTAMTGGGWALDKPLAFLLNPPYKSTDEGEAKRTATEADYALDPAILDLTGADAGKERYLAFLAQIHLLALAQVAEHADFQPVLLVFTPTSWLIPRPTYAAFRARFDAYWEYENGFLTTSNEFFKLGGKWPVAFTIWKWRGGTEPHADATNTIRVRDLTALTKKQLDIWHLPEDQIAAILRSVVDGAAEVTLEQRVPLINRLLPSMGNDHIWHESQPRYDINKAKRKEQRGNIVSGFPAADSAHHFELDRKCGEPDGTYVGFMDNLTPLRVKQDSLNRLSNSPNRVWFYLDTRVIGLNITKIFSGPPDQKGYCAYDLPSAKACFGWFAVTKALNNNYPTWFNQYSLWAPDFARAPEREAEFYRLAFAFGLAENRCVEVAFPADDPVADAPAARAGNPLAPGVAGTFWETTLAPEFVGHTAATDAAAALVDAVRAVYGHWATAVCGGQPVFAPELHPEAYFRFFHVSGAVLGPRAGLVQIRAFAAQHTGAVWYPELQARLSRVAVLRDTVRQELYRLLTGPLAYFG